MPIPIPNGGGGTRPTPMPIFLSGCLVSIVGGGEDFPES